MSHAASPRLTRTVRYALLGVAAVVLVALAAGAYFAATFDAKAYVPQLAEIVRERTGRTLTVSGDIKLSLWPDLAIDTGALSLSERDGSASFATVDSMRLRVKLRPLLSSEVIVEGLDMRGAHVNIIRDAEGRLNIDDLLGREASPTQFDIGHVIVNESTLTFRDLGSGARYEFSNVGVTTGRLTNAVPTTLALTFDAARADATWHTKVSVKSGFTLDQDQQKTIFEQTNASGTGQFGEDRIEFTIAIARAESIRAQIVARGVEGVISATGAAGATHVKLNVPLLERNADVYHAGALACDLELDRGETRVSAALAGALDADGAAKRIALTELKASVVAQGPHLPGKKVTATTSGTALVDIGKEGVHLKLAGEALGSRVAADIDAAGFAAPVYTFKVNVDKLDLDRYSANAPSRVKTQKPEDLLQPFADLPGSGTLHVGVLKAADVIAKNVTVVLR